MSPKVVGNKLFDRARTISIWLYGNYDVYLVPFSSYSELFVETGRFKRTPPAFGAPIKNDPFGISQRYLYYEN